MSLIVKVGKKGKKIVKKLIMPAEKHNLSYTRRIERVKTDRRICAMTFDDGPCRLPANPDQFGGRPLTLVLAEGAEQETVEPRSGGGVRVPERAGAGAYQRPSPGEGVPGELCPHRLRHPGHGRGGGLRGADRQRRDGESDRPGQARRGAGGGVCLLC